MKKSILGLPLVALSFTGAMAFANAEADNGIWVEESQAEPSFELLEEGVDEELGDAAYFDARGIGFRDSAYIVRCESNDYRYRECRAPGRGRVVGAQIVRQMSMLACTQGRNWGVTNDGVWVSNGCRAEFRVLVNDRRDDRRDDRRGGRGDDRRGGRGDGRGDDRRGDHRDDHRDDHRGGRGGRR